MRFAQALSGAASLKQLERRFLVGFGRLFDVPMYAYDLLDPVTGRVSCVGAAANISDAFAVRYEREGRDLDPVTAAALKSGRPAYNRALMSEEEWLDSPVYRTAYHLHGMRHVAEAPVMIAGRLAGTVHFATSDADRGFTDAQLAMAGEIAALLGLTLRTLEHQDRLQRERDQAAAALALTGAAVLVSDPHADELQLNDAARQLVADVVDAGEHLNALIARPADGDGCVARRAEVELVTGETAVLHSRAIPAAGENRGRIAVLELEREHPGIARDCSARSPTASATWRRSSLTGSPTARSPKSFRSATTRSPSTSSASTASSTSTRASGSPARCSLRRRPHGEADTSPRSGTPQPPSNDRNRAVARFRRCRRQGSNLRTSD